MDFLKKMVKIQWKTWLRKIYYCLPTNPEKNIPDPRNTKEHYQSFIIMKNRKSLKQS